MARPVPRLRLRPVLLAVLALAAVALGGCAAAPAPEALRADPREMRFPTLPLAPPQPKRVALESGLVVYMLRHPEVPLVTVQALVRTGAVLEPATKIDLAELTGRVMRTGGTAAFTGQELNRRLESLGASLETGIGRQSGTAALSVLAPDLPVGIELLAEVLRRPAFDAERKPAGGTALSCSRFAPRPARRLTPPLRPAARES